MKSPKHGGWRILYEERDTYKHETCGRAEPLPDMPTHCGVCGWQVGDHAAVAKMEELSNAG